MVKKQLLLSNCFKKQLLLIETVTAGQETVTADKHFHSWMFKDNIEPDISDVEFSERKLQLIEHFQTRTTPKRPACVQSVAIFANLHDLINVNLEEIQTVSIEIIGYLQTKGSRKFTMTNWIRSATSEPVLGGLCSSSDFLADIARANNVKSPWFRLPIFGDLGLNNQGRIEARKEQKVSTILSDFHSAFFLGNVS